MSFKNWKNWYKSRPLSMRWFVLLVLFRPIIDQFYFLKNISPVISPLYVIGVLTPVLILLSLFSRRMPKHYTSVLSDSSFLVWTLIVCINLLLYILYYFNIDTLANAFKYLTPIFLFYYFRRFINTKENLIGILQTFYFSALFPLLLLCYEMVVSPINPEYLTESRGGEARIQGGYADIMNYAIYISSALIFRFYLHLKQLKQKTMKLKNGANLFMIIIFCFIGLIAIKQTASWGVAFFLLILFVSFNLKNRIALALSILLLPILILSINLTFESKIKPLLYKEYEVLEGEREARFLFNGRVSRWIDIYEDWEKLGLGSKLFGATFSGDSLVPVMISGGMHSDYVRLSFLSGILGLGAYLMFLFFLFRKALSLNSPEKFLLLAALGATLLYSISTNPLLYAPYLYFIFPIFAYASLPKSVLKKQHD